MNPEYSEEYDRKPLLFKLFEDWDTEEVIQHKKRLKALVNGDVAPCNAAIEFNTTVVQEADLRKEELLKHPDPQNLIPKVEEHGIPSMCAIALNPSGDLEELFQWIVWLCSAFLPQHPGQD